ncbi:ComEC/Rec2 family competence protein [Maribacter cobaltidurans]|uniref:Competence protein n=1 Tax=Maribacter cobaltidurans TaxID=1178778 RepID=A0A223V5S4_9FLAO|nr:ComEC/Rec2 family competence protein [Maribacter cobaltidurans]ASV30656.1 competence protein [Maribacter cobaltidurans]GGD80663.1 competence protein ComEC [Maribacter cobaltidurans]
MKLLAYAPIKLSLLLILGILLGYLFPVPLGYSFCFLLISMFVLGYIFVQKKNLGLGFELAAAITVIFLGIFSFTESQPINHDSHFSKITETSPPLLQVKIYDVLKPNTFSQSYLATVLRVDGKKTTGNILVNQPIDSTSNSFQVDDELFIRSKILDIKSPLNPHQFDFRKYMGHFGVYHSVRLTDENSFSSPDPSRTLIGHAQQLRSNIIKKLSQEQFGREQLSIIQALLLGERDTISQETYTNYVDAGAVHILAVSGLHIGILLLLIQFLLRPLNLLPHGRILVLTISVVLLWGFAFLAGLSPSIIRACTMFSFVAYAMYLNRPSNSFNILALSMFFILLAINPNLLFQVGFQMSYAAVFAIVWIYPLLQQWWFPKNKIVRYLWQLLSVSVAAQLGVLPISLFYFHQFPGLFFISNLLIVPFLGLILGMGILIILLSLLEIAPRPLIWFYNEVIGLMNKMVGWIAEQEAFVLKSISFDNVQLFLGYLIIGTLIYSLTNVAYKRVMYFLGFVLIFQLYVIFQNYTSGDKEEAIILHQVKNSVLFHRNGHTLNVMTSDSATAIRLFENYRVQERIDQVNYAPLKNSYTIEGRSLLIIDSTGVYTQAEPNSMYVITQSPKINLERFIQQSLPKEIIADGSNYPSYVERWKQTCLKHKIPFHYTGEMGFYVFK